MGGGGGGSRACYAVPNSSLYLSALRLCKNLKILNS